MSAELTFAHEPVVDQLRQLILQGTLSPGQRLIESELAELLGVTRGAVRSAIVDLGHEGLIERVANRGARVRVVCLDEAIQITEICIALEGLCAGLAAERITDDQIRELGDLRDSLCKGVEAGDVIGTQLLNQQLHQTIIELADRPIATETLGKLRARNARHQYRLAFRPGRTRRALEEHLDVIDAISSRDSAAAEAAMRRHMGEVLTALRDSVDAADPPIPYD